MSSEKKKLQDIRTRNFLHLAESQRPSGQPASPIFKRATAKHQIWIEWKFLTIPKDLPSIRPPKKPDTWGENDEGTREGRRWQILGGGSSFRKTSAILWPIVNWQPGCIHKDSWMPNAIQQWKVPPELQKILYAKQHTAPFAYTYQP